MSELKELRTKIFELHTGTRPKAKDVMATVDRYAEKLCEKQRELCFKQVYNAKPPPRSHTTGGLYYQSMSQKEFRDTILNAPTPEFD